MRIGQMKSIRKKVFLIPNLLVIVISILASCSLQEEVVNIKSLLDEIVDRDAVASFPQTDFRLKQESSYNRASISPEDSVGWFKNQDFNSKDEHHNFIRIEENNGHNWSWSDCEMAFGVGVYWYGDATTASNRLPDPKGVIELL